MRIDLYFPRGHSLEEQRQACDAADETTSAFCKGLGQGNPSVFAHEVFRPARDRTTLSCQIIEERRSRNPTSERAYLTQRQEYLVKLMQALDKVVNIKTIRLESPDGHVFLQRPAPLGKAA
jgi:hypothetical protein